MKIIKGVVLGALVAASAPLHADFTYTETTQMTGGSMLGLMKMAGAFSKQARQVGAPIVSTVAIKGNRMVRINPENTEIIDLDAETITNIDTLKRQYTVITFAQMKQQIEAAAAKMKEQQAKSAPAAAPQQPSNSDLFDYLQEHPVTQPAATPEVRGDVEQGLQAAAHKLEATYTVAYIAHVPLEPRSAVAEWSNGKLTVWTGTQRPFGVRSELAKAFGIREDLVRVIVPDTGSAYGGKHTGEAAVEAARLAKAAGKPVKLIWSRQEEFTWGYFRPAGVIEIRSGVSRDGLITAWEFQNYNSGSAGMETPYDIANRSAQFHATESPLRQGSYRGSAATANHFARESHMDDLAAMLATDPLEFRMKNLKNDRLRAVLETAAQKFGWANSKSGPDHGIGLACGVENGGYVATCAEASIVPPEFLGAEVTPGPPTVKIERVVTAFECGAIMNPEHLKSQIEGALMMGIGGALFEAIEFANGRILNSRLSKYRVPRFSDLPVMETVLVDRKDLPSAGAGGTPIVAVAPAVGNAIFHATGTRIRSLPMTPRGFPQAL